MRAFGFGLLCALTLAGPSLAGPALVGPNLAGMWRRTGPEPLAVLTAEGKAPPLKPDAKKVYLQRLAERKSGKLTDLVEDACLPPGTPRIMWSAQPFLILQAPRKVTLVHEFRHVLRHIYLGEDLPKLDDLDLLYGGTSAGRWDGDALVVQTAGFNDKTWLDRAGLPHSEAMKVTERLRLVSGGKLLEDRVTIDDPEHYAAPWTTVVTYRRAPGVDLKEDVCAEKLLDPALRTPAR
jgi:hypothetical protein